MDGVFCFGCGAQLEGRKGDRRLIVSPNNSYVFPVLHNLVTTAMAETSSTVDRRRLSEGYICRPCFRAFEKLHTLNEQTKAVHEQLFSNAKKALPFIHTLPASSHQQSMEYRAEQASTTSQQTGEELKRLRHASVSSESIFSQAVAFNPACSESRSEAQSAVERMEFSTSQPQPITPMSVRKRQRGSTHSSSGSTSSPQVAVSFIYLIFDHLN